ncbi:hypothetical protein [Halanaerobium sp. ST460_2HS_T2]|uniref:hypothetical protein n=1 Tax=Halanaerobium sp. ST460_2HS_T2 TaxID=2183914 RepID=UPI0011C01AD9|nr:hypothetical protein [Halanaerobium sp. ST460_2HS_T2]
MNYKTKGNIPSLELDEQRNFHFLINPIDRCSVKIDGNTFIAFYKANEENPKCKKSYLVDSSVRIKIPTINFLCDTSELKNLVKIAFEQNKAVEIEIEITCKNNNSVNNNDQRTAEEQKSFANNCCEMVLKKIKVLSGF